MMPVQGGGGGGGGGHDLAKFRITIIHRFMTSHPVVKFLLCFCAKHQDGRPMLFGFFVILTHRYPARRSLLRSSQISREEEGDSACGLHFL